MNRKLTDKELSDIIDKMHLRTFIKVWHRIKKEYPNVPMNQVKRVMDSRVHDPMNVQKRQRKYMNKLFSNHINNWQMDLLINGKNSTPPYWYIFINVNNKFARAYKLNSKTERDIKRALKLFYIDEPHVSTLTCDQEGAFCSDSVVDYLTKKKTTLRTIADKQHTSLAVIDRFIRTLRDMNILSDKNTKGRYSTDPKYQMFTEKRMKKLIDSYNKTYHSEIRMTPEKMHGDVNLETQYIVKCLCKQTEIEATQGYALKENEYVRLLLDKKTFKKRRFRVSREYYKVAGKEGKLFIIMAADGSTHLFPRWKIVSIGMKKPTNMKMAETFDGPSEGELDRIIDYNEQTKKYKVVFKLENGEEVEDEIPQRNLRQKYLQLETPLEKEFWANRQK